MKQRIRSIFLLMTLCILGINLFQGYWLYTTYQLNQRQFVRTVREALLDATQKIRLTDARQLFSDTMPSARFRLRSHRNDTLVNRVYINDEMEETSDGRRRQVMVYGLRSRAGNVPTAPADTLARDITRILIDDWSEKRPFNLARLDSAYRTELRFRSIDAAYVLDTLTHQPAGNRRINLFNLRSTPREGYSVQTPLVPVNPVRGLFVQASFVTPTSYLLHKMGWLLGGSVLLLALTTGCFLFMLSTILRQKKLSEIRNDFINNMTHELKTPIATVSAAVEALQHFGALDDPKKTETYLNISRNELQRLSDLVEKVLNMAVDEQRELTLDPEWLNPGELIRDLVERQRLKAPKPVEIVIDAPEDTPQVQADRLHVSNVINNLIDNAIKYSGESVRIGIRSRHEDGRWLLAITDNGIGIPKSYQEAIFDRFFRVPTGNLHPVKGFGLGLYYVRQVIEKHGGQITVQSEPGRGSEFRFWI